MCHLPILLLFSCVPFSTLPSSALFVLLWDQARKDVFISGFPLILHLPVNYSATKLSFAFLCIAWQWFVENYSEVQGDLSSEGI